MQTFLPGNRSLRSCLAGKVRWPSIASGAWGQQLAFISGQLDQLEVAADQDIHSISIRATASMLLYVTHATKSVRQCPPRPWPVAEAILLPFLATPLTGPQECTVMFFTGFRISGAVGFCPPPTTLGPSLSFSASPAVPHWAEADDAKHLE